MNELKYRTVIWADIGVVGTVVSISTNPPEESIFIQLLKDVVAGAD